MKYTLKFLGCKVNAYEAESIAALLEEKGYEESIDGNSDVTVILTCAVTNTASQKSRQMLHRARRANPNAAIVLAGCYSQVDQHLLEDADIIVGTENKMKIGDYLDTFFQTHEKAIYLTDLKEASFEQLEVPHFEKQARAYLKIEDGCNQYCSYCIIPYARGRERSMPLERVLASIRQLAKSHREIVLSGIHTGRYGREFNMTLAQLLKEILKENKETRFRISSIEITEIDEELIELMKENTQIARHLHIPLQSGSDTILKTMNRPYSTQAYYDKMKWIQKEIPGISISTDLIVGFPGETDTLFEETYAFLQTCGFSFLHVFPFSMREGTRAAEMDNHISSQTKKERVNRCLALSNTLFNAYQEAHRNQVLEVIVEQEKQGKAYGYSSEYIPVMIDAKIAVGTMVQVQVQDIEKDGMIGIQV